MPSTTDAPSSTRLRTLAETDPAIATVLGDETTRQNSELELIASENFVSRAVLEAAGSVLTNKYAEGYPGRRYYGGCEHVDVAEALAIERACGLFGADRANVQPHSGAQANMAAYFALIEAGDTVLGMNLAHGGHLTHGHPLNFSGQLYSIVPYGVRKDDERLDYDELAAQADAFEIGGVVERGQGGEGFQAMQGFVREDRGALEGLPAVNHAVSHSLDSQDLVAARGRPLPDPLPQDGFMGPSVEILVAFRGSPTRPGIDYGAADRRRSAV